MEILPDARRKFATLLAGLMASCQAVLQQGTESGGDLTMLPSDLDGVVTPALLNMLVLLTGTLAIQHAATKSRLDAAKNLLPLPVAEIHPAEEPHRSGGDSARGEAARALLPGDTGLSALDLDGAGFQHIAAELDYPGPLPQGDSEVAVRRVQEWLNLLGWTTPVDGRFGSSTAHQLRAFQASVGREPTGQLDPESWALLTAPIRRALTRIDHGAARSLEEAVVRVARQHMREAPTEIGGINQGPWVRLYMAGVEGPPMKWCAGFVCFVVAQAARDLAVPMPFPRQVGVNMLVDDADAEGRFIGEEDLPSAVRRQSKLRPGTLFVVRAAPDRWVHAGIVLEVGNDTFDTLEGNTGGDGGVDGPSVRQGNRSYEHKDFLNLL